MSRTSADQIAAADGEGRRVGKGGPTPLGRRRRAGSGSGRERTTITVPAEPDIRHR